MRTSTKLLYIESG